MILLESCLNETLPCSESYTGNLFLVAIYAFILAWGSKNISDGSEELLEITPPGIIGGIILPLLGTLPDSCIIIASCIFGTKEEVQHKLAVAVGTLAGSDVLLLTLPLAAGIWVGRCDIKKGEAVEGTLTTKEIKNTGVTVFPQIRVIGWMVLISLISFVVIQIGYNTCSGCKNEKLEKHESITNLIGMILSIVFFVGYTIFQFLETTMQSKRNRYAKKQFLVKNFVDKVAERAVKDLKFTLKKKKENQKVQIA